MTQEMVAPTLDRSIASKNLTPKASGNRLLRSQLGRKDTHRYVPGRLLAEVLGGIPDVCGGCS